VLKLNFQWPLQGIIVRNFLQTDRKGIDIKGKSGQAVHAAEAGKAVYCGIELAGLGNLAIIKHDETYLSAYANNSTLTIKEGQQVEKGQTIGQVGSTGLKKALLHFEIRKHGKPINPLIVLPKH
jgi:lipoprotein NlpD